MAPPPQVVVPNYSENYIGSFDEWVEQAAMSLAEQYINGIPVWENFSGATGSIGQPAQSDFNSRQGGAAAGTMTPQTMNFFRSYVRAYAKSDPWLAQQFGPPPTQQATYTADPSSPGATTAANNATSIANNAATNLANTQQAQIGANAQIQSATISANASMANAALQAQVAREGYAQELKIALMQDATQRYVAEGNWGTQKYVAQLQETGMMDRLKLELGMRDKELAQRAVEERNRNQLENNKLALAIAQYDAELSASPRNWLAYAAWLQSRNIVVNGLTLAMAAQEVPEGSIDPGTVAEVAGPVAGILTAQQAGGQPVQDGLISGASGGSASGQNPFGPQTATSLYGPDAQATASHQIGTYQPPPSGQQLDTMSPTDLANQLLGMSPGAATPEQASQGNLQSIMDSIRPGVNTRTAGFGAYGGPTTNALGVDVGPGVSGAQIDYRQFAKKLPTEQSMFLGGVESVRGSSGVSDWAAEIERSRPKGRATGAASYG